MIRVRPGVDGAMCSLSLWHACASGALSGQVGSPAGPPPAPMPPGRPPATSAASTLAGARPPAAARRRGSAQGRPSE